MADSIVERLVAAAERPTGVRFVGHSVLPADCAEGSVFVPWAQVQRDAQVVAAALQARGLVPGDHVAILGPTSRPLITIIRGCWLAGCASMVLPLPMRMGSLESFIEGTRSRIRHGDAKLVLIDELLAGFYESAPGDPPIEPMASVLPGAEGAPAPEAWVRPDDDPDRLVILQYTSGSTSEPKGVMIPDRVLRANIDACSAAASLTADEVMVSWLPLYHDMGLVGFLSIPMTAGVQLVQAAPQDFLAKPGAWLQWISDWHGTATAGPNFAWVLATRALGRMEGLDLSSLTLALSGAEPVDPNAVEAFVTAGRGSASAPRGCSRRSAWPRWPSAARSRPATAACAPTRSTALRSSASGWRGRCSSRTPTRNSTCADCRCSALRCRASR